MKKDFVMYMGGQIRKILNDADEDIFKCIREIRIRANQPLIVVNGKGEVFINSYGKVSDEKHAFRPCGKDVSLTAEILGGYSLYAFDEELRNGFITIEGGHRVGVCGKALIEEGNIKTLRNITSLNFRIASEVKGCADSVVEYIANKTKVFNTLIVSPPGGGKTTFFEGYHKKYK